MPRHPPARQVLPQWFGPQSWGLVRSLPDGALPNLEIVGSLLIRSMLRCTLACPWLFSRALAFLGFRELVRSYFPPEQLDQRKIIEVCLSCLTFVKLTSWRWQGHDAAMKKRDLNGLYRAFGDLVRLRREQRSKLSQEKLAALWGSQGPRSPTSKRGDTILSCTSYWRSPER
jgi:hypothetical protein